MSAPVAGDFSWHPGANGVPTNDTDPTIGAIQTGSTLTPDEDGQIIEAGEADVIGGSERTHYGGGYIQLDEGNGGSLQSAYLWLANGGLKMPSQGQLVFTATANNVDLEIVVTGMVTGEPVTEELTMIAGAVATDALFDSGSHWAAYTKDGAVIAGSNGTDDIAVSVSGTQVALMRAPRSGYWANGCTKVGSLYRLALASAADETVSGTNRLTLPTASSGLTSFSSGAWVAGSDQRQSIGTFADQTYRGFVLSRSIPPGFPMPEGGFPHILVLSGLAAA